MNKKRLGEIRQRFEESQISPTDRDAYFDAGGDAEEDLHDLLTHVELVTPVVEAAKRIDYLLEARCRPHDPAANQRAVERADAELHAVVKRLKDREPTTQEGELLNES